MARARHFLEAGPAGGRDCVCSRARSLQHRRHIDLTPVASSLLQGAGAADAFLALRQHGAPQEELRRPALLRPLAALAALNGHPVAALLAANLLRGVAEAGADCCEAVRYRLEIALDGPPCAGAGRAEL